MKKDNIRDYATEAFRYYAAMGRPSYDAIKDKLYRFFLAEENRSDVGSKDCLSKPTEQALINAQNRTDEFESELKDILAVENTLKILSYQKNGADIKKAIEIVYFTNPTKDIGKGEISERVHAAELAIRITEPTVYRYLRQAREIFASERGLSSFKFDNKKYKLSDILKS